MWIRSKIHDLQSEKGLQRRLLWSLHTLSPLSFLVTCRAWWGQHEVITSCYMSVVNIGYLHFLASKNRYVYISTTSRGCLTLTFRLFFFPLSLSFPPALLHSSPRPQFSLCPHCLTGTSSSAGSSARRVQHL